MSDKKPESYSELINSIFLQILREEEKNVKNNHKGESPEDYLYDHAEKVVKSTIEGLVTVWYKGQKYPNARVTWGPLDGDKEKLTVLVQTKGGLWYKLWFFERDIE